MKKLIFTALALLTAWQQAGAQEPELPQSQFRLRIMPQIAFGGYNNVQLPNHEGTRFSLSRDLHESNAATFAPRIEFEYVYRRNHFIVMGSLLRKQYAGTSATEIRFGKGYFEPGTELNAVYRFNTYRFTYRYGVVDNPKFKLELGATVLVRDAMISLAGNCHKSSFYNVGVVPLLSYNITWQPTPAIALVSYGDAFGINKGRAEDIFAGIRYDFADHFALWGGYRLLEGGSNGDNIYTFALFHYVSLGLEVKF